MLKMEFVLDNSCNFLKPSTGQVCRGEKVGFELFSQSVFFIL